MYFIVMILGLMLNMGMVMDSYADESNKNTTSIDSLSMETKGHVKVSVPQKSVRRDNNMLYLTINLDMEKGWHINTNPASLDFLIPTSIDVRDDDGKAEVKNITYPASERIPTPLGDITVFGGDVNIPVEADVPDTIKEIRILIRAQACNDTGTCLQPSDWVILLTVP